MPREGGGERAGLGPTLEQKKADEEFIYKAQKEGKLKPGAFTYGGKRYSSFEQLDQERAAQAAAADAEKQKQFAEQAAKYEQMFQTKIANEKAAQEEQARIAAETQARREAAFAPVVQGMQQQLGIQNAALQDARETQAAIRARQMDQTGRLEAAARGESPSIAEAQLRATTDRSLAQQLAASKSARGGNAASRERQLATSQAGARRDIASQSVTARLAEQQMAEQALAQQLASTRGQDIGVRSQDIGVSEADRQARIAMENLDQQRDLTKDQMALQRELGMEGYQVQREGMTVQERIAKMQADAQRAASSQDFLSSIFGGIISGGSTILSKRSDKNVKKNIKKEGNSSNKNMAKALSDKNCKIKIEKDNEDFNPKSFLDKLQAYSYEYKDKMKNDPRAGEGRFLSVMAQDLEKAGPVGKQMVIDTPEGKMVDYGQGFAAILAAQAHLNQRLADLEKKKKK